MSGEEDTKSIEKGKEIVKESSDSMFFSFEESNDEDFEKMESVYEKKNQPIPFESLVIRSKWLITDPQGNISLSPEFASKQPLLVFANPKSGGNRGSKLIKGFKKFLHHVQVQDITAGGPQKGLKFFSVFQEFKVLVCGGDGTVAWVLSALDELDLHNRCSVAILPLGTGNDLSRVLGWGPGFDGSNLKGVLTSIESAHSTKMDRWEVEITEKGTQKVTKFVMNNYFSVGMGAKVCLNFNQWRNNNQKLFSSRAVNKAAYALDGFIDSIVHSCKDLEKKMDVYFDDETTPFTLPIMEEIIILNIASYGGGTDLWGQVKVQERQEVNDKKLEVLSVDGSFQMGAIRFGLASPTRIKQVSKIVIQAKPFEKKEGEDEDFGFPIQIDGEASLHNFEKVTITHKNQVIMLKKKSSRRFQEVLQVMRFTKK